MDAAVSEAETPRNSSDIRNSMFSRSSPGPREEIDLCTPASVLPQQVESGRRSTISGSQSRQSIDSAEYLDIGKASIHSGASGIQCQSERNSCDRNTVDTSARARRLGSEPISDVPRRTNLVLNNKPVLEPRKCNKQDAKHRLFDVPLSDDLSSEEDLCRSDLRSAGKFKESNEAVGHVAKSRQLPTLDDDPTSSSDSNAELRQRSVKGRSRRMRKQRPAARANETLLNTSLVREINEEIDSLKRTFLAEPADLQPTAADTTLPAASASLDCEIPSIPPPPSTSETDTVSALLQSDKNDSLDAATADSVASVATQMQNGESLSHVLCLLALQSDLQCVVLSRFLILFQPNFLTFKLHLTHVFIQIQVIFQLETFQHGLMDLMSENERNSIAVFRIFQD